ncbi:hypothetical protein AAFF_G00431570 [Aldrovandia affinis]|uniref:Integrase catalytic domain-containing protein n=1 Tax=Aldrovandia affinis TaxID=143900 RepID=A0AAD7S8T9_9TELE|nr:hypothetical protein AAFF_G00431570 [Aldrovandia affinis]
MLSHPVPDAPIALTTDASDYAVGAVLEQLVPERHFDHINVDIVGPLPPSRGFTHLLTMVDRTTRWPEAVPLASTTTADVARAFIDTWVSRFGTPSDLSSDRGSQFTSELWAEVARALGVRLHHTTAFHPQANGLCERFHRSMKAALRASLKDDSWTDRLPWVLLGLRTAPKEDLQSSSAELVFGQALRVPGDFIPEPTTPWVVSSQRPALLNKANAFKPVPTSQHGLPRAWIPTDLSTAQYVFIRHNAHRSPLKPPYDGPFRVMETGDKTFSVDVGGKPERITVDRLKPAHQALDQPVVPAAAPRRGRPPSIRPTRAAQVPSPDVAPRTTAATLPRTRAGRDQGPGQANVAALMGKLCMQSTVCVSLLYAIELFPIIIRQKCVGLVNLWYRVGCILNTVVAPWGGIPPVAMICYGCGPILGAGLCLLLPETSGQPLPDTVPDCEAHQGSWIPQCCGPSKPPDHMASREQAPDSMPLHQGPGAVSCSM